MSFTSTVKNEVSTLKTIETENIAELSAIIRNIGSIAETIKITTENESVAKRIFSLIKDIYKVSPKITVRKGYNYNKNYLYLLEISNHKEYILEDTCLIQNHQYYNIPKEYIISDTDLKKAYIRGIFLSIGSINDPKKSRYHLEFQVDNEEYAKFVCTLLNEFLLNPKYLKRENKYMVYLKEAEKIGDLLRIIGASKAVMYYEDIRIYRGHKNMVNRLNNCEQANVDKMIASSMDTIKDIQFLKTEGLLETLDDKLKEVAHYRETYPEVSLAELSEIISVETGNPITKSGLHHRLKKITQLTEKIKRKQNKS